MSSPSQIQGYQSPFSFNFDRRGGDFSLSKSVGAEPLRFKSLKSWLDNGELTTQSDPNLPGLASGNQFAKGSQEESFRLGIALQAQAIRSASSATPPRYLSSATDLRGDEFDNIYYQGLQRSNDSLAKTKES